MYNKKNAHKNLFTEYLRALRASCALLSIGSRNYFRCLQLNLSSKIRLDQDIPLEVEPEL